ncbi:MAG: HD domain-containing protein [Fibrobacter sp.]|nr:HD domain-containing protein [Fibrobacter sp.]
MKVITMPTKMKVAYALGLILAAFLINIIFSKIALALELPVFLDCLGTILAAMLGGTFPAVIAGFCSNAFNGISDLTTLYYGIINILIGVTATLFQQKGFFRSIPKAIIAILVFALLGGALGSILTYFLYGYDFGEGISAPFSVAIYNNLGFSKFFSQLSADFIIDIFDKAIIVAAAILIYRKIPLLLKHRMSHVFLYDPNVHETNKLDGANNIKRSLLRKVVIIVIAAEILLGAFASITGFVLYRQVSIGKFVDIAHGLTEAASVAIDAERIDEFLEQGEKADDYKAIEAMLYKIRNGFPQALYLYVYRILPDGCHVVFDLDASDGEAGSDPGAVVAFDPSFEPYLPNLLKGEPIDPIISDDQYGWLLTVYKPLKNFEGKTVAYVAADISMGEIITDQAKFFIKLLSMFFGLSILIMSIVLEFMKRGIVHPVNRMASGAMHFAYNLEQDSANDVQELESLDITSSDEIGHLYKALTKMCKDSIGFIRRLEAAAERIQHMQDEIIINFAEMVEARDTSTGNHIKKTAFYVEAIAKELYKEGKFKDILDEAYIAKLKRSAPLHDIGKIAVSDLILNKPGKLTDDEFAIMKSHTTEGWHILTKIEENASDSMDDDYLKEATEMAHYHHEKWDGTGYPTGIKGAGIPLSARIMAVADVFDALVAERVYKKPFTYEKAMQIITEGSGKHFDPTVVEAFTKISQKLYDERTVLNQMVQSKS